MKIMQIILLVLISSSLNALNTSLSNQFSDAFKNMPAGVTVTPPTNPGVTNQLIVVRTPQGDQVYSVSDQASTQPVIPSTTRQRTSN